MKQLMGGVLIAALASLATLMMVNNDVSAQSEPPSISITEPSPQDA